MNLDGKTAIITGSTSGIGKAIAESFAARGANIVINGIESAEEVAPQLAALKEDYAVEVLYSPADMRNPDEIEGMVNQTLEEFGSIDFLVNNAGIQHKDRVENFPEAKWDAIIAINLSSAFHTSKFVIPHMQKQNFGRIVNISSAHGLVASPEKAAYVAAKHGIIGLTKVIALENATQNITVNAVCPGWVETELVKKQIEDLADKNNNSYEDQAQDLVSEKQANGRFATPESIGRAVLYLADPENNYTTGTSLSVDGGWTAQ